MPDLPLFFAHGGARERVFTAVSKCFLKNTLISHHTHIHTYNIHILCLVYLLDADTFINSSRSYENLFLNVMFIPSLQWDGGLGAHFLPAHFKMRVTMSVIDHVGFTF